MYLIETGRLRLRPLTENDREAVYSVLLRKEIMEPMHLPATIQFADGWLHRQMELYEARGSANWYLERREDGAFIGLMGVVPSKIHGVECAELGYLSAALELYHKAASLVSCSPQKCACSAALRRFDRSKLDSAV